MSRQRTREPGGLSGLQGQPGRGQSHFDNPQIVCSLSPGVTRPCVRPVTEALGISG